MGSTTGGAGARVGLGLVACGTRFTACFAACFVVCFVACVERPTPRPPSGSPVSSAPGPWVPTTAAVTLPATAWPEALAIALAGRGEPHVQPVALPRDSRGRARWLAFVGTREVAWGAWHVTRAEDGTTEVDPIEHWPAGVRVVGAVVDGGVAYVLLESVAVLDQPSGLRATWIDGWSATGGAATPFEASPMALVDVRTVAELASRVSHPPRVEHDAGALLTALRAASASTTTLASALAREGADVRVAWQSLFAQRIGHLDAETAASSLLAGSVLAVMREALATQACGLDACEAWTDGVRAVVRFVWQDGRWAVSGVIEDAPAVRSLMGTSPPREVPPATDATDTESLVRARARQVLRVLGQAPLMSDGGTIGVALTDLAPDTPVVAVREGDAARVFVIDASAVRAEGNDVRWDAAFADVDGDGRTDVVLRWSGTGPGGVALSWTQVFVAPPPSVQAPSMAPDLPTALALMDARDVGEAAHLAVSTAARGMSREDACRLLTDAATPAGFRKQAAPDARLLQFDEPGMPTWRPKVIPVAKLTLDDLRGLGEHCAELACSATRPYCAWTGGADSEHLWFDWRGGRPEIVGVASYEGE